MSENNEINSTEEQASDIHKKKSFSNFFYIPHISLFLEGNPYISSENTFNYRIKPEDDKLTLTVWYGMKCLELSEPVSRFEDEKSEKGLAALASHIDNEFIEYRNKVDSGEVKGRRTYKITDKK